MLFSAISRDVCVGKYTDYPDYTFGTALRSSTTKKWVVGPSEEQGKEKYQYSIRSFSRNTIKDCITIIILLLLLSHPLFLSSRVSHTKGTPPKVYLLNTIFYIRIFYSYLFFTLLGIPYCINYACFYASTCAILGRQLFFLKLYT